MDKIKITNILKIRNHRYSDDAKLNRQFKNKTIILMCNAMRNKGYETLLLMRLSDFKYETVTNYREDMVSFSDNMEHNLNNNSNVYVAIHNHPNDSTFSVDDLQVLVEYNNLRAIFLCTNTCKYNAMILKNYTLSQKEIDIMRNYIKGYKQKNNGNGHISAEPLLKLFTDKRLLYVYYTNY